MCVWLYVCIFTQFQFQSFNHVSPANCLSSFFSLSQRQLRRSFQLFAYTHTRIHSLYMCSVCVCVCACAYWLQIIFTWFASAAAAAAALPYLLHPLSLSLSLSLSSSLSRSPALWAKSLIKGKGVKLYRARGLSFDYISRKHKHKTNCCSPFAACYRCLSFFAGGQNRT